MHISAIKNLRDCILTSQESEQCEKRKEFYFTISDSPSGRAVLEIDIYFVMESSLYDPTMCCYK